eukprot:4991462-Amphidinium_carterae.2
MVLLCTYPAWLRIVTSLQHTMKRAWQTVGASCDGALDALSLQLLCLVDKRALRTLLSASAVYLLSLPCLHYQDHMRWNSAARSTPMLPRAMLLQMRVPLPAFQAGFAASFPAARACRPLLSASSPAARACRPLLC